jgi:D-sedoheptulose 7-phosphate isomerase
MQNDATRELAIRSLREGAELRLELIEACTDAIALAADAVYRCLRSGGKVLLFGNGGSAADAQHVAAEFVGRFARDRVPLPAIALTTDTSALTSISNDYGFEQVFARPVIALGQKGDVAIAISTSGNSPNVLLGVVAAREKGLTTIGLTGGDGGRLASTVDFSIVVPSNNTARIQECHLAVEHIICEILESLLLAESDEPVTR